MARFPGHSVFCLDSVRRSNALFRMHEDQCSQWDQGLTDRGIRVIAARKAWIEHRQIYSLCKNITEDQSV